jgi:hypothetical protein
VCESKNRQQQCTVGYTCHCSRLCLTQVDRWRHSLSDVVEYVTTEKVTRIYFQHTVFVRQWEIQTHWVYTGWLLHILKLSFWKKEWTSLIAFTNWEFLTGCLLSIINRTRAFLKFKVTARLYRLLYLKSELLSRPLHSVKRKPILAQLSNCHNNREKTCIQSCHVCVKLTELTDNSFIFQSIRLTTDSLIWQYLLKGGLWRYLMQM